MSHSNPSEQSQPPMLAGVQLPGSGRLRLCDLCHEPGADLAPGAWVAIESAQGVEVGQVTITPEQLLRAPATEPYGRITRRLNETEVIRVAELADEARSLLVHLASLAGSRPEGLLITGLRFSLHQERAIVSWHGDAGADAVEDWLRTELDMPYVLEHEGVLASTIRLYGGLGRLRPSATSLDGIVRRRFEPAGSSDRPAGFPRLLSRVSTPQGEGVVVSVSTKHQQARVKLAGGDEMLVPLDELQVLGWMR